MFAAGVKRRDALRSGPTVLELALTHYGKRRGMLVFARDGGGFDICLADVLQRSKLGADQLPPDPALVDAGRRLFGDLRVFTTRIDSLLPRANPVITNR